MFICTQNIYSLNNPVHLAILLILVQTINKNFTHPYNLGVTYGKKSKVYANKGEVENAMKDYKT